MRENGFVVQDVKNMQKWLEVRGEFAIPNDFRSCHTAIVDGLYLEGHIPAEDVKRLLREKPKGVIGISVPGMPAGSPGMERGDRKDSYNVFYFTKDGNIGVWARH